MHPCDREVLIPNSGLSRGVRETLADPIVQALLAADGVDPRDVADLARRMAASLFPPRSQLEQLEHLSQGPVRPHSIPAITRCDGDPLEKPIEPISES